MKRIPPVIQLLLAFLLVSCGRAHAQEISPGPRTIVTTDGEIDDVDSFIRLLLMSNEFRLEGLVYSSSQWHYKGDGKGTEFVSEMEMTKKIYGSKTNLRWPGVKWMQDLVKEYKKVYPVLRGHAEGFPTPAYLKSIIKVGNIDFEGEMEKDTKGSAFIKEKLLDATSEPIYLQVWGGTNTIARALKSIEDQYKNTAQWASVYKKVSGKAIIYTILDQDATYRKYISKSWPDIRVYYNQNQFWSFAYFWKRQVPQALQYYFKGAFMGANIINNHGPLTKKYYSWGDGQQQPGDPEHTHGINLEHKQWGTFEKYDFISEGDSPSYFHLVDVGLGNLEHPEYGGWGGRLVPSDSIPNRWEDGQDVADFNPYTREMDPAYPQTRWLEALQLEFAARADWCIKPFNEANHPPLVSLGNASSLEVTPGQTLKVLATATDPDGDSLAYNWWQYWEVDSYPGKVKIIDPFMPEPLVVVPDDIKPGETIHLIVSVTDGQFPNLTRYQRVILHSK
jgi:hypothetical protein